MSEAFSFGLPVVMSEDAARNFGVFERKDTGCVGVDTESFKNCILRVHESESTWLSLKEKELDFIRETHDPSKIQQELSRVIDTALQVRRDRKACGNDCNKEPHIVTAKLPLPKRRCPEGERLYFGLNADVEQAYKAGRVASAFRHWKKSGFKEGRIYMCYNTYAT